MLREEKNLFERILDGDQTALKELYESNYLGLTQSIFRLTNNWQESQDLAQDVFIQFWQKKDGIQIKSTLSGYLHQMAIHLALEHIRKEKRRKKLKEQHLVPKLEVIENEFFDQEMHEVIRKEILKLPEKCGEIFILSRYEGLSYREIALSQNISIKTVENQIGKALKVLRKSLKPLLQCILV